MKFTPLIQSTQPLSKAGSGGRGATGKERGGEGGNRQKTETKSEADRKLGERGTEKFFFPRFGELGRSDLLAGKRRGQEGKSLCHSTWGL